MIFLRQLLYMFEPQRREDTKVFFGEALGDKICWLLQPANLLAQHKPDVIPQTLIGNTLVGKAPQRHSTKGPERSGDEWATTQWTTREPFASTDATAPLTLTPLVGSFFFD